jgi:uncharacterized SAM-binding protein YcdF (DUF218 family)
MFFVLSKLSFLILRPSNAVILAMLAGLILRLVPRLRRRGTQLFSLALVVLVLSGWTGAGSLLIRPLEDAFSPPAAPERLHPRGIVILGGGIDTDVSTDRGTPEFVDGAERLIAAARLARLYPEAEVIYSGGTNSLTDDGEVPEADFARDVLVSFGVPAERILVERTARNTIENARKTLELAEPQPSDHWILVTSAFHMPRAMGTFRAAGWSGIVAWPVDYRTNRDWHIIERHSASEGLSLTDLAVKEWIGLVAYRFAGYTDSIFPVP